MAKIIGKKIIRLEQVDSTNSYLKNRKQLLQQHGLVVITKKQTAGRGRAGRKFLSLPEKNLTFSIVLHPNLPLAEVQIFALLAGIVVARVLDNYFSNIRLKWPNDVLVRERKICGILLETDVIPEHNFPVLILGIGLNTKGGLIDYPDELQSIITTMELESASSSKLTNTPGNLPLIDNETVLQQLLTELEQSLEDFSFCPSVTHNNEVINDGRAALLKEWLQRADAIGRKVRSLNKKEEQKKHPGTVGIIEGMSREGFLLIRTANGHLITHVTGDILEIKGDK
ncbi:MAG: biotin--[acetyl-CoA-carboxylase] ligase [SAR324 cluster bacterium]|nr:biotin--[acetyl-CoA-carboxylase] ligase [SAR324 cluster bacterium]MBL7035887.1 biotin--[acetyl-CoA-carboxylase] ligase [SAR324 cluster bacterium]